MYAEATIQWDDDKTIFEAIIKLNHEIIAEEDDEIFYYVGNEKQLKNLMKKDNGEDFTVLNYNLFEGE